MDQRYMSLGLMLMRIGRARRRVADGEFKQFDIHPGSHFLLMHLSREGAIDAQKRIAERMDVSPAFVARSLKSLESDGYIVREDGQDMRRNETRITPKGQAVVDACRKNFMQIDRRCFEGFDERELDTLEGYLTRILDNLNRMGERG